ncbi:hypothetical protein CISIN_1g041527mg, partial [Citrus sinensis]
KKCAFLNHVGTDPDSAHKRTEKSCEDLMNQSQHIQHVFHNYTTQDVIDNRLRLKFLIRASRYLALQGSTFRGHDGSESLDNRGNFLEILEVLIYFVLSNHTLDIQNIRGQGYYIASDMRGEWNGLQALILKDCPCTYYIHCLAHRLQLALVAASRVVILVHQFFTKLTSVVNIVRPSCKRNDELKHAKAYEIAHMLALDELETGKWLNQIGTLQRAGETQWGSHFKSVSSLINMFSATCQVLINIVEDGVTYASRGDADAVYGAITSFEFVFVLHLMKNIMAITDLLSQALQCQSQDILNAMRLISSAKVLLQKMRDEKWQNLLENVISFCKAHNIDIPNMNACYIARQGRRSSICPLVYRIIVLVLTLPVSTATIERSFSAMRIVKTRLRNKIDYDSLTDTLITYIEKDIAKKISMESVIDDFRDMKERKVGF